MLGNPRALPLLDDTALSPGDVVADVVLQSLTLLLGDNLALGLGLGGEDLLRDGGALLLKPGGVLLILCSGVLLLVNSSLNTEKSSTYSHSSVLGCCDNRPQKPADIASPHRWRSDTAAPLGLRVLNRSLGDLTLPLVGVGVHSVLEAREA